MVCFFCVSTRRSGRCSTVNVQVPPIGGSFAWTGDSASTATRMLAILKHLIDWDTEHLRDSECDLERRRVLAELDRVDRLSSDADLVGEPLLRHLLVLEAQP